MKLLVVIVHARDARRLRDALVEAELRFTELGSTGGFLRQRNVTLLIGLPAERVDEALALIRESCQAREELVALAHTTTRLFADPMGEARVMKVGGAHVFIVAVEQHVAV